MQAVDAGHSGVADPTMSHTAAVAAAPSTSGMPTVRIVPFEMRHVPDVERFNDRLLAGGGQLSFGTFGMRDPVGADVTTRTGIWAEAFVAEGADQVHGAYRMKHQQFLVDGSVRVIGNIQQPISEAVVDPRYALIGPRLLRHALHRQPLLYALGIGGPDEAVARLMTASGFAFTTVPFYVRIEHPKRVLGQVRMLRSSFSRRLAADIARHTGAAKAVLSVAQRSSAATLRRPAVGSAIVSSFDDSVNGVWDANRDAFAFAAVRTADVLGDLYDGPTSRYIRIAIADGCETTGWAVCLVTDVVDHRHFGTLRLGSIVDLLARPEYDDALVRAALVNLRRADVDLIVTNQSSSRYGQAMRRAGFLRGPSNFLFGASRPLVRLMGHPEVVGPAIHVTRGDGDGPINL